MGQNQLSDSLSVFQKVLWEHGEVFGKKSSVVKYVWGILCEVNRSLHFRAFLGLGYVDMYCKSLGVGTLGSISLWPHVGLKLQSLEHTRIWWTRPEVATEYPGPSLRKWSGGEVPKLFSVFQEANGKEKAHDHIN